MTTNSDNAIVYKICSEIAPDEIDTVDALCDVARCGGKEWEDLISDDSIDLGGFGNLRDVAFNVMPTVIDAIRSNMALLASFMTAVSAGFAIRVHALTLSKRPAESPEEHSILAIHKEICHYFLKCGINQEKSDRFASDIIIIILRNKSDAQSFIGGMKSP